MVPFPARCMSAVVSTFLSFGLLGRAGGRTEARAQGNTNPPGPTRIPSASPSASASAAPVAGADEALDPDEPLRGETLRDELEDDAESPPSTLQYAFGLGLASGESFAAPPLQKTLSESLWNLRFGLALPFSSLEDGSIGAGFDFELDYPLSMKTSEGQNTHRFRFDPALTFAWETLFADDVTALVRAGLGFGVERVQYSRASIFAYGPFVQAAFTAYMDKIPLVVGWSPFARIPLRYKPPFSKYQTSGGPSDADLAQGAAGRRTGFSVRGNFSSASAGFELGTSGSRDADGSRSLVFVGGACDWHRYSGLQRSFETGRPEKRGASLTRLAVQLGFERGY